LERLHKLRNITDNQPEPWMPRRSQQCLVRGKVANQSFATFPHKLLKVSRQQHIPRKFPTARTDSATSNTILLHSFSLSQSFFPSYSC
jgi:hypothetical protein